jgi:hypothetical protein
VPYDVVGRPAAAALLAATLLVTAGCTSTIRGSGSAITESSASATPGFPQQSASSPTSTPTGPTLAQLLTRFSGSWTGHGRALTVRVGVGHITYRTYRWCSADPTPPCDEIQGNEIIDGGRIAFRLNSAYEAGTATIAEGVVSDSTDPTLFVGQPLTARIHNHLLSISLFANAPFCDSKTPPVEARSCGA